MIYHFNQKMYPPINLLKINKLSGGHGWTKVDRWTRWTGGQLFCTEILKFFFFKITHYENTSIHLLL